MKHLSTLKSLLLVLFAVLGGGNVAWAEGNETFSHSSSSSSYSTISWTGDNGQNWGSTNSRGDQVITTGNKAITTKGGTITGNLTEEQAVAGVGFISFKYKLPYSEKNAFQVKCKYNGVEKTILDVAAKALNTGTVYEAIDFPFNISGSAASTTIEISVTNSVRFCIDDLSWTSYEGSTEETAPTFLAQPEGAVYEQNESAEPLLVTASGYPTPKYQWYSNTTESNENGTILNGETNSTFTPSTETAGTVYYYCVATNSVGEAVSNVAAITVKPPFAGKTLVMSAADDAQIKFVKGSSASTGAVWSTANPNTYDGITLSGEVTSGSSYTYYDGSVVRFYTNNKLIITPSAGVTIEKVEIVRNTSTSSNGGTINCTGLTASKDNTTTNTNVFTGTATSAVTFTSSAQARFTSIKVYYTGESSELNVPSFTLAEGTYFGEQTVKVADYDEGLIYYYTTDGEEPTVDENFAPTGTTQTYDDATGITVSATTTLKMIACYQEKVSPVKTATYTITVPDATNIMALRDKGAGTYNVMLTDAVVTYVNNKNAYVEDATGGLLIYASHSLKAGDKINGQVDIVLEDYNGTDEATTFDISKATVTSDNVIPVTNVTLAELLAEGGMKKYESMRVCVSGIQVVTPIASRNGVISQDGNQIAVREGVASCLSTTCLMTANAMANVYGYPTTYTSNGSTTYQLNLWNASAVEEIPSIIVSAAGYATYFNSTKAYTMPAGCEGYVFSDGTLAKVYDEENVVPANEPLVIKAEAGTYVLNFTTSDKETYKSANMNDLEGTDEKTALTANDSYYFYALSLNAANELNSVGFYWMNETGAAFTNGAHKAYLKLAKGNGAAVKGFAFNDLETAIQEVEANTACGALYDLSGRKVNKAQKGIYIINGKKVVK